MKKTIHRAATRGYADHGWLRTHHTFSFAGYYDPGRIHFGALRVLNDDTVAPGEGFGTHPHENMEIVSLVLSGALRHGDSMGNMQLLKPGELQVMIELAPAKRNEFRLIVAPEGRGGEHVGWIHQTAWFHTLDLDAGREARYRMNLHGNGAYVFVIEGTAEVAGEPLGPRDGMGISDADDFLIRASENARLLVIEVPMI